MDVEKRFSNLFPTGEAAHAFEVAARGAAIEAGLSVGSGGITDRGLRGVDVLLVVSGEPSAVDGFAAELHDGTRPEPLP